MLRRAWLGLALAAAAFLCGCATDIAAKVTNFNAWPRDAAGATFAFQPPPGTSPADLEQATYESYVRAELERQGLRMAPAGQAARFTVALATAEGTRQRRYREPVYDTYPPVWIPPVRDAQGNVRPGFWQHDPFGMRYIGDREVVRTLNVSRLRLTITDATMANRPVFNSTAVYEGDNEDLPDLVPWLVRALFENFPGQSGRVTTIRYDPKTGQRTGR